MDTSLLSKYLEGVQVDEGVVAPHVPVGPRELVEDRVEGVASIQALKLPDDLSAALPSVEGVDHPEPKSKVLRIVIHGLLKQVEPVDLVGYVVALAEMIHRCQDRLAGCCGHDELVELGYVEIAS